MIKSMVRIFWLLLGIAGVSFGAYTFYQKQYFPISHSSFALKNSNQLYIPNFYEFAKVENGFLVLESYVGDRWSNLFRLIAESVIEPVSANITKLDSLETISFKGGERSKWQALTSNVPADGNNMVTLNGEGFYFWKDQQFVVFSTQPIEPVAKKNKKVLRGNANFFFRGTDGIEEAIKLNDKLKFSAFLADEDEIKGKPINAKNMLSVCPLEATFVKCYGSSRFESDVGTLQNIEKAEHVSWVDNGMIYFRKDSFEILAGLQGDNILLRNLLLESISENDIDLNPPIYYNSTEILSFNIDWTWQNICVDVENNLRYYASYKNFVFLSNNLQSMYWLLKNIQLGKTYDGLTLLQKIPARMNTLALQKSSNGIEITSKTWISKNRTVNLSAVSNAKSQSNKDCLIAEFSDSKKYKDLLIVQNSDGLKVIATENNSINAYNLSGNLFWTYKSDAPIAQGPKLVKSANDENFLVFSVGNSVKIIDTDGNSVHSFDNLLLDEHGNFDVYNDDVKAFVTTSKLHSVTVFDLFSQKEQLSISSTNTIESTVVQKLGDNRIINVYYKNDSIDVFDLKSKELVASSSKRSLKGNCKPLIDGSAADINNLRLTAYENNYIKIKYFSSASLDSIKLNVKTKPDKTHWINCDGKWLLALEYFDRLTVFNELGLIEIEMAKPEANLQFVAKDFIEAGMFVFLNTISNKYYFTDSYGSYLIDKPIGAEGITSSSRPYLISKNEHSIYVYKLNY